MASVNKRRWTAPNGEEKEAWVLRYKDTKGKHRQETFARKKEADARRSIVEGELRGGMHIAKGAGKKLAAVADEWLSEVDDAVRRGAMRPRSAMNYENHARLYVVPEFGDRLIHEIEPLDVERWLRIMHNSGTLAASSVKARFAVLKLICDFAIRHKWAKVNPCSTVRRELRSARRAHRHGLHQRSHFVDGEGSNPRRPGAAKPCARSRPSGGTQVVGRASAFLAGRGQGHPLNDCLALDAMVRWLAPTIRPEVSAAITFICRSRSAVITAPRRSNVIGRPLAGVTLIRSFAEMRTRGIPLIASTLRSTPGAPPAMNEPPLAKPGSDPPPVNLPNNCAPACTTPSTFSHHGASLRRRPTTPWIAPATVLAASSKLTLIPLVVSATCRPVSQ